jgi:hypothetical protein
MLVVITDSEDTYERGEVDSFPNLEIDIQAVFLHPIDPVPVTDGILWAVRRLGDGKPLAVVEKQGQQDGFTQVLAPNGPDRIKNLRLRASASDDGKAFDGVGKVVKAGSIQPRSHEECAVSRALMTP